MPHRTLFSPLMSGRALLLILLFAGWVTAATRYWWTEVPAKPSVVHHFADDSRCLGVTRQNELAVLKRVDDATAARSDSYLPELRFINASDPSRVRIINTGEPFGQGSLFCPDFLAVQRQRQVSIFSTESLQVLDEFTSDRGGFVSCGLDGTIVLYREGDGVVARDVRNRSELWRRPGQTWRQSGSPSAVIVSTIEKHPETGKKTLRNEFIDAVSGTPLTQFDHIGKIWQLTSAAGATITVVTGDKGQMFVCDTQSGRLLGRVKQFPALGFAFTDPRDSAVLDDPRNAAVLMQLRTVPEPPPLEALSWSRSERFGSTLVGEQIEGRRTWPRWLRWMAPTVQASFGWNEAPFPHVKLARVVDIESGQTLVRLPVQVEKQTHIETLCDDSGVLQSFEPFTWAYFSIPPRRDIAWLARWATLPPLAALTLFTTLSWLYHRLRRQARSAPAK
jgi:hypothetical protein